ncbi:MAG: DUF1735 domain-containing protein [Bacteroidales bacterium]|nr:DUF1735 domain-containing protein [Bacteroidales bacterium]
MKKVFYYLLAAGLIAAGCAKETPGGGNSVIPGQDFLIDDELIEVNFTTDGQSDKSIRLKTAGAHANLRALLQTEAEWDAIVNIEIDRVYLASSDIPLLPESLYTMEDDHFVIEAGELGANLDIEFKLTDDFPIGTSYVLPLVIEPESVFVETGAQKRVVFTVSHVANKDIETVLYYEVNNVNPLNAGEVLLEDSSPFFDYVILFASNINYNSDEDRVYLHQNANCKSLYEQTDTYIQPLRRKGIKVLMSILGNHDASGVAQLSNWGCEQFAREVARAVKLYKLDGINLDDEYSNNPDLSNKWFTNHTAAAGARLAYELKKAMIEEGCEDNIVTIFAYSTLNNLPAVTIDGVTHNQSEFIDQLHANYGSSATPRGDLTKKNCTYGSYECNNGQYATQTNAQNAKNNGYGFIMYFNPDPSQRSGAYYGANGYFAQAARGLYGKGLKPMANWYKKIDEGVYDPKPYSTYPW